MAAEISRQDDHSVADEAVLWRRIQPGSWEYDANVGRLRPWSSQFDDDELSVVLASAERDPRTVLNGHPGYALVAFTAKVARGLGQVIVRDPVEGEPDHCLVIGAKSKGDQRRMAREAAWVVGPDEV